MSDFQRISYYSIFMMFFVISVVIFQTKDFFNDLRSKNEAEFNFQSFSLADILEAYGIIMYSMIMICSFF